MSLDVLQLPPLYVNAWEFGNCLVALVDSGETSYDLRAFLKRDESFAPRVYKGTSDKLPPGRFYLSNNEDEHRRITSSVLNAIGYRDTGITPSLYGGYLGTWITHPRFSNLYLHDHTP